MRVFLVSEQDNDTYAFREGVPLTENQRLHQSILPDMSGRAFPGPKRCPKCGELLAKWTEPLDGLKLAKRKYDLSTTYDGVTVASRKFIELYELHGLAGLAFRQLPNDPTFFAVVAEKAVAFDAARRQTRFEDLCPICKHYRTVVVATPVYLKPGYKIGAKEFVRTDLEFASGDEKSPLLLCGEEAAKVLKGAKLKGIYLEAIKD